MRERSVLSILCDNWLDIQTEIISPKNKKGPFQPSLWPLCYTNWFPESGVKESESLEGAPVLKKKKNQTEFNW
jgi:hypothetical protein